MSEPVYADYNATAPLRPEAKAAVTDCLEHLGNPSSVHRFGRAARASLENSRETLAEAVGAAPSQVVFTSGGTEANALALSCLPLEDRFCSAIEHDAVLSHVLQANSLPVSDQGYLDLNVAAEVIPDGALVSLMLANNETGVLQPVAELAEIVHARHGILHCDAVQALGKTPVDFEALDVDMMSLSAHKIGGPPGVGALVVRDHVKLKPLLAGGGQERRKRPGTENLPGIAGFAAAMAASDPTQFMETVEPLRDRFEASIVGTQGAEVFGAQVTRLANTSCVGLAGVKSETQVMALDLAGVAVSAGSACSSGKVTPSHVLSAMGKTDVVARSAIRVSLGWDTTSKDVEALVRAWTSMANRLATTNAA